MPKYQSIPQFEHGLAESTGILLVNLGTPDAPTPGAVRRFLKQCLWDPRVVEYPRWLWWLILHGVILRIRPARSAAAYREVWTEDGSPLLSIARAQRDAVAASRALSPPPLRKPRRTRLSLPMGGMSPCAPLPKL